MPPRSTPIRSAVPNRSDHDLLIRIDTRLEVLSTSVSQNHDDVSLRLTRLDSEKAGYKDLDILRNIITGQQADVGKLADKVAADAEKLATKVQTDADELAEKVDWTRRMLWLGIGGLIVLNIVVPIIVGLAMRK
jgi:hypothetical protein